MKTATKKMSADELRWQAESDCRTLEEYQQIIRDKARLDRAMLLKKKSLIYKTKLKHLESLLQV